MIESKAKKYVGKSHGYPKHIHFMKEQILEEIYKYAPHTEQITLSTLMAINQKIHICNVGSSGIGKSHSTGELLKLLKIPHHLVAGHTSPKAFFEILKQDGIIIVDEGATILSDNTIQNLLLNALWNGKVEWRNNRETHMHQFRGVIIFNVNRIQNNEIMEALQDRIFTNKINLTSEQIKEKIKSSRNYKPNIKTWAKIKEKLLVKKGISEAEKEKLYHLIETFTPKSTRVIWKLSKIASFSLSLVEDLSLIEYFIETDEVWKIINMKIKRSEKVKKIAELKCITERQARRIVTKFEK